MAETIISLRFGPWNRLWLPSDVSNSTTSLANVTNFGISVSSGKTYKFKWFIDYTSTNSATGGTFCLNGPSFSDMYCSVECTLSSTTTMKRQISAYDTIATVTGSIGTGGNICVIDGIMTFTANGTLIPRFKSETSGQSITAKTGHSHVEWIIVS